MADEGQRFTTRTGSLQSRIAKSNNAKQQQTASSSAAAKSGSTTTPTVTSTPKVTNTAKAMPSVTRVDISKFATPSVVTPSVVTPSVSTQTATTPKAQVTNLLGSKTKVEVPKKAENLLNNKYDVLKSAIPGNVISVANATGGNVEKAVNKTILNQFTDWFKNITTKSEEDSQYYAKKLADSWVGKSAVSLGTSFERMINDTEYYVAKLADVVETSLGGKGGFEEAFQKYQGKYWDIYTESGEQKANVLYEQDKQAQNISKNVGNFFYDITGNREISDMLGNVAGRVTANLKDPEQVASTIGYMAPALILGWASGGGFLANTAIRTPSQSTQVYKDFSTDKELANEYTDNQLFGISIGLGTVLSMVETFGDALGDMPWAKSMSRTIRNAFTKSIKNTKLLTKDISDVVDNNLIKSIRKPVMNALKKWYMGSTGEGIEEVVQDTLQTEGARLLGSKRKGISLEQLLTTYFTAKGMGAIIQGPGTVLNIKNNSDLKKQYNEYSDALDKIAPGINKETKEAFFSAMITSQQNDANLSEKKIERYEEQTTELYNQIEGLSNQLQTTTDENAKTQINNRINELNNQIKEIDKKINQWNNTKEAINESIREYNEQRQEEGLPATQQGMATPETTEQISRDIDTITQGTRDIGESKQSFDKSIQEIKNGTKYYDTDFAQRYAYKTSGRYILGDTKQNQQMINKVQSLLKGIGIKLRINKSMEGTRGLYDAGIVYYKEGNKELTLYGHEVFHAMMDVINNGELNDKQLQNELQNILNQAIEDVKKEFGIDEYKSGEELKYANKFAEEWLANAFGEYLEQREIEGPKTFVQKIIEFFNKILDLFSNKEKKSINKELKKAFDKIANGEVTGRRGVPKIVSMPSASPLESSTDETQEAMASIDEEGYKDLVKENELQSKQQQALGDNYKKIVEAGKESDKENETYDEDLDAGVLDEVTGGDIQTSPQTIKDMFSDNSKKRKKAFRIMNTEIGQAVKDAFTPALTRIYNISPRVAGRMVQMETQSEINIYRFRERAKPFVEAVSKLSKEDKLELKKVLLDYGALASEQTEENLAQYKEDEAKKLKEAFKRFGISEESANDMFAMLTELGQRYKDAGLSITLNDLYFPRTVTDYEGLSEYISDKTGVPQKEREDLLNRISKIRRNENLTDEQKEGMIRNLLVNDYKQPGTTSKNAKERKIGKLSDWGEGIYEFYADPMETLDSYIVNMENAIQRQLFLGGLKEEAGLKGENVSFTEIVEGLVDEGKISNEDLEELKKSVLAILNKKPSPRVVSKLKNLTYIATLANFLSAINQLDDLAVAIIKDKRGLINVVKAIFGKAGIKYTELGLEDSYEMFRGKGNITNWFFKKSLFNAIDRLGKTAFVNAAWDSLKTQAKKNKDLTDTTKRANLKKRLEEMYGKDTMEHVMKKIDENSYMTNGQIDIDILTDLLYQLGSTQPIYTSAMPTAYLNNGWVRLCYALQSFTIKRIDMLVQGAYNVYKNNGRGAKGAVKAGAWLMEVSVFLALFGVAIGDLQDWIKGDTDETVLWKLLNEGIDEALDEVWHEGKASWLKIWNLSLYDKKTYQWQGLWGVIMNKVKPPMIGIGKNFLEAITEHNADEMTDLVQYVPIIGKLLYYRFLDEIESETTKKEEDWETTGDVEAWESLGGEEDWETESTKEDWE